MTRNAFGVYVHFPYCRKRCPYCDFAVSAASIIPHEKYAEAVLKELADRHELFSGRELTSIYIGGGTPSLWKVECLEGVLNEVRRRFLGTQRSNVEITVECDPTDLSLMQVEMLRDAGVNRISLGIQSLDDSHLQQLGRLHTSQQARHAASLIREAGIVNLSVDLMIGLPGQSLQELDDDIEKFLSLSVEHISIYQLTIEPHTAFAAAVKKKTLVVQPDEKQVEFYSRAQEKLTQAGFMHYEISSYARSSDVQSRHNRLYWTGGEYLGLGVSAHSFRRFIDGSAERFANAKDVAPYSREHRRKSLLVSQVSAPLALSTVAFYEKLSAEAVVREAVWLSFRQVQGFSRQAFKANYGVDPFDRFQFELESLLERGLVVVDGDRLALSQKGILFADAVGAEFL